MNSASGERNFSGANHDLNMFLDRQVQNKLLDIDDQLWLTDYMVESKGYTDVKVPKTIKVTRSDDIMGWFSSSKCVLRKPEKEKQNQQPVNSYSWREQTRLKNLIQDGFVFKHYPYSKSYIEQYREENSQLTGMTGVRSPIVKDTNEPKRVGIQTSTPSPPTQNSIYSDQTRQNVCNHCNLPTSTSSPNLITAAFNYTRRETTSIGNGACKCNQSNCLSNQNLNSHTCSKHNHHQQKDVSSLAYKYKLTRDPVMHNIAWRPESEHSSETEKEIKTPRILSGKRSAGKPPTKVTVPNGYSKNVQTVTVQQISQGKALGDGATVATAQSNLRALDALACVAAEKQMWFDTAGRAYVSLAARYDPLKK